MKRIVTWLLGTVSVVVLLFGYHTSTAGSLATPATSVVTPGSTTKAATSGNTSTGQSSSGSGGATTPKARSTTKATSTTVTGHTVETQWGPVQVQITVGSGAITDVSVLQYPSGNGRDLEINSYALPILVQETEQAQSADIDMVSGATVTSVGYLQSLQSALDQAGL